MIDTDLLRKLGWSSDLIEAAQQVAEIVDRQAQMVSANDIQLHQTIVVEESSTLNVSEFAPISTWPSF